MKTEYKYEWTLNVKEMIKFRSSKIDSSIYSGNFNGGCWCIVIMPCGVSVLHKQTNGYLFAKFKLLKASFGIETIEIDTFWILRGDKGSNGWIYTTQCGLHQKKEIFDSSLKIDSNKFKNGNTNLTIIATMKIRKIFDENGKQIRKSRWKEYGIND